MFLFKFNLVVDSYTYSRRVLKVLLSLADNYHVCQPSLTKVKSISLQSRINIFFDNNIDPFEFVRSYIMFGVSRLLEASKR